MSAYNSPNLQEALNYCASRLRAAVVKISDDRHPRRSWWNVCFMLELVSVRASVSLISLTALLFPRNLPSL